jgi:Ca2+-binding RTX toxin-like protein
MATIDGTGGFDVLEVTATDHGLDGKGGNDLLLGAASDDGLIGGNGNDWLYGAGGNDNLTGGKGNDVLSGGDGNDVFVFSGKSGKDVITDFDVETDVLQIAKSKFIKNVGDVVKHAKQLKNGDLEINLGHGNKIILKDVTKAEFKNDASSHIDVV